MDQLTAVSGSIALLLGASWASGINLYAAILALGIMGQTGAVVLPEDLMILSEPVVIFAAGFMYMVEFFVDKVPGVDTGWDTLHTFIRIPAGALLAYGAAGEMAEPVALAAALLGGGMAATTHATKAGSRVLINTSPEPFSNWTASITEDVMVFGGIWAALHHPWLFLVFLVLFLLLAAWLLPKIFRGIKKVFRFIIRLFGGGKSEDTEIEASR